MGVQQKKFVLIAAQTQRQARQLLQNIKQEIISNELLSNDLGPFMEDTDEFGSYSIVIPHYNARITAVSTEQSIRGMRHGPYRPDLIICDDIEDSNSVRTKEGRDKTYDWYKGEALPAGDTTTKRIVVGNMLHQDSLVMRLKESILSKRLSGTYREYPLLNSDGDCLWPGKYPNKSSIERERMALGDEVAWKREFMLIIVPTEDQVVHPDWIHYYDELPSKEKRSNKYRFSISATDLAISQRESADYFALVSGVVFGWESKLKIYILPFPINKRLTFPDQKKTIRQISLEVGDGQQSLVLIENNGYQDALVQALANEGCSVEGIKTLGQDKRSRLSLITPFIKNGTILFPRHGAQLLIQQCVGFGVEKHDDLMDALIMLVNYVTSSNKGDPNEAFRQFIELNQHLQGPGKYDQFGNDGITLDMRF